ncbi:terminase small subunit [Lysinibacillus boronitolerans]|uniref:terminase small subunit n=1 Tax=Lysinibacillus boronitolerans TaxID=309788 RepID=UPI003854D298
MKLTPKQQAFADYYIVLGNAKESALKTQYSKDCARSNDTAIIFCFPRSNCICGHRNS